jgi:hypothetical protein
VPALHLGKQPATHDSRDLLFSRYVNAAALPTPPKTFGHDSLFAPKAWGMLGNDEWGDCAWAGPAHETMLLTKEAGHGCAFTTQGVLADYSAGTGFNAKAGPPGSNPTDRGSNVRDVLSYRRKTGIVDSTGKRHKIGAFIRLDPKNLEHVYQAMYLFQAVGIGIQPFPKSAMDQFNAGEPWDVVPKSPSEGGHYVCCLGKDKYIQLVTWGSIQPMTEAFFEKYCDEAWTYLSTEDLKNGANVDGFDMQQLRSDLKQLTS